MDIVFAYISGLVIYLWSPKMDLGINKVSKEKDTKVIILEIFITSTPIFDIISDLFCNSHSMHLHSVITSLSFPC